MKKNMNRLATLALSGMMVLSTAAPVFATNIDKANPNLNKYFGKDEANAGKSVAGGKLEALGNSVSFDKIIRLETDDQEMVDRPDVNWAYSVKGVTAGQKINTGGAAESEAFTPGTTKILDSKNNEILVLAGQDNMIIEGQSDLNASFKPSDLDLGASPAPALGDFVDGVKITFDISKFSTPGVYRFVVKEGDATGPNSKDVEAMDVTVDGAAKPYQKEFMYVLRKVVLQEKRKFTVMSFTVVIP